MLQSFWITTPSARDDEGEESRDDEREGLVMASWMNEGCLDRRGGITR